MSSVRVSGSRTVHARSRCSLNARFRAVLVLAGMITGYIPALCAAAESSDLDSELQQIDKRLRQLEQAEHHEDDPGHSEKALNPAISVILEGVYASYKNDPGEYTLPGFMLGGEAGLAPEGFSLGHSEIIFSGNIDDRFYGKFSLAISEHDNDIEVGLEEAFFETSTPGAGFELRGGRFYSAIGYQNQQHRHVWDFYDASLVYRALFGDQYFDDGLRVGYVAPTRMLIEFGIEALSGRNYPAGGEQDGVGNWTAFATLGGDIGKRHAWRAGLSFMSADDIEREHAGHDHAAANEEVPLFEGSSRIAGANAVYEWLPEEGHEDYLVKLQFEYFNREENGNLSLLNSSPLESGTLESRQDGWYLQGIWQFAPAWRTGLRYDRLDSDNRGSNPAVLDEAGLVADGHRPERISIMAEWLPGRSSRFRLQYNRDDSYQVADDQVYLQYTLSLGSHRAHTH